MERESIRTRTTTVSFNDGIMQITFFPGAEEKLADARENVRIALDLAGGRPVPLLVDMRAMKAQDRDARDYYNDPEVRRMNTAVALLAGSRISSLIANFFISITSRDIARPIRMFTDEAEALAWLKGRIE